jgi:hypothetical protein
MEHNPYSVGEQISSAESGLHNPGFAASIRLLQIISAALMMGVLSFLLVVLLVTEGEVLGRHNPSLITVIAAGIGLLTILIHFVLPTMITGAQLKSLRGSGWNQLDDAARTERIMGVHRTQHIIGLAVLEGAAFLNLIALMIGHSMFSTVMVVLLLSLMLAKFPTETKVSWWVQEKLREINW